MEPVTSHESQSNASIPAAATPTPTSRPRPEQDGSATSQPPRKRRRPALACEQCRRRKIKCDRNTPCDQCIRSRSQSCTYSSEYSHAPAGVYGTPGNLRPASSAASSPGPGQLSTVNGVNVNGGGLARRSAADLSHVLNSPGPDRPGASGFDYAGQRSLPAIQSALNGNTGGNASNSLPIIGRFEDGYGRRGETAGVADVLNVQAPNTNPAFRSLVDKVCSIERQLNEANSGERGDDQDGGRENDGQGVRMKGVFSKTRLFGQSHWINFKDQFETITRIRHDIAEGSQHSELRDTFKKCKHTARLIKSRRSLIPPNLQRLRDYVPERALADELTANYFRTFESIYRILHVPTFQRDYAQYWNDPNSASTQFVMKMLLVMAIGCPFVRDTSRFLSLRASVTQWVSLATTWLMSPPDKHHINVSCIQIHCLLLVARHVNDLGGDTCWLSAGYLVRTAIHAGLHRDPKYLPKITPFQAEIRRRLWATVLELLVQSSMDSGGPPLISIHDFDTSPPSNLDDTQLDETARAPPLAKPLTEFTQSSIQVMLMKTLFLRLRVAKLLNDFYHEPTYDEILRLGSELTSAFRSDAALFQSFRTDRAHPTPFDTKIFNLLTQRFLLAIHLPFAIEAKQNPTYYFSRKVCLETSLSLHYKPPSPHLSATASNSNGSSSNTPIPVDNYARIRQFGGGLFRNILLHSLQAIAVELLTQLRENPPSAQQSHSTFFTSASASLSRHELRKAIEEYNKLLLERLKTGETNVNGHVFVSAMLAQVDALTSGGNVEQEMLGAMRKAVGACEEVLRRRLEEVERECGGSGGVLENLNGVLDGDFGMGIGEDSFCAEDLMQSPGLELPDDWLSLGWDGLRINAWL